MAHESGRKSPKGVTMSPYRIAAVEREWSWIDRQLTRFRLWQIRTDERWCSRRRRWRRLWLLWRHGSFRERFPVRCPQCGKPSRWNPHRVRRDGATLGANEFGRKANRYECGHRADLRYVVLT